MSNVSTCLQLKINSIIYLFKSMIRNALLLSGYCSYSKPYFLIILVLLFSHLILRLMKFVNYYSNQNRLGIIHIHSNVEVWECEKWNALLHTQWTLSSHNTLDNHQRISMDWPENSSSPKWANYHPSQAVVCDTAEVCPMFTRAATNMWRPH